MFRHRVCLLALGVVAACRGPVAPAARACDGDDELVRGACVSGAVAGRYCGPAATWVRERAACVARTCDGQQVRDEVTGDCVGARGLRSIGERQAVIVDDEHLLGCRDGAVLHVAAGHARCVEGSAEVSAPREEACGRGEVWDGRACARVVSDTVDVATWARAAFGPSGSGSARFCARACADPVAFGALGGLDLGADVDVQLIFPDNDVTGVYARLVPARPIPAMAIGVVERAVAAELELLRALGGTSSVGSLTTRVRCPVRAGVPPLAVPKRGSSALREST